MGGYRGRGNNKPKPSPEPDILTIDSNEESQWKWSGTAKVYGWGAEILPLEFGDFRFFAAEKSWLIERKSVPNDIESSFTDGRLAKFVTGVQETGEQGVILLEGDTGKIKVNYTAIMNTLFEAQTMGIIIHPCREGEVIQSLTSLKKMLDKADHVYFRKPVLPLPSKYDWKREVRFDGGVTRFERVRTGMTFRGVSEDGAVEWLKRYTLGEVMANPDLLMDVLKGPRGGVMRTIARMKEQLGLTDEVIPASVSEIITTSEELSIVSFDRRKSVGS